MEKHAYIDSDKGEFQNHMRKLKKFDELEEGGGERAFYFLLANLTVSSSIQGCGIRVYLMHHLHIGCL